VYLVESSDVKNPIDETLGYWNDVDHPESTTDGFVSRNIRMSLDFARLAAPYVIYAGIEYDNKKKELVVRYKGGGCFNISNTNVTINNGGKRIVLDTISLGQKEIIVSSERKGYMMDPKAFVEARVSIEDPKKPISLDIAMTCDGNWGKPPAGIKIQEVQSLMVRMRTTELKKPVKNGNFSLKSYKNVVYKIKDYVPANSYFFDTSESNELKFMANTSVLTINNGEKNSVTLDAIKDSVRVTVKSGTNAKRIYITIRKTGKFKNISCE